MLTQNVIVVTLITGTLYYADIISKHRQYFVSLYIHTFLWNIYISRL